MVFLTELLTAKPQRRVAREHVQVCSDMRAPCATSNSKIPANIPPQYTNEQTKKKIYTKIILAQRFIAYFSPSLHRTLTLTLSLFLTVLFVLSALDIYLNFNFSMLYRRVRTHVLPVLMLPLMPLLLLRFLFSYFSSSSFPIFLEIVFATMTTDMACVCVRTVLLGILLLYKMYESNFAHSFTRRRSIVEVQKILNSGQPAAAAAVKKTSVFDWQMANWHPAEPERNGHRERARDRKIKEAAAHRCALQYSVQVHRR